MLYEVITLESSGRTPGRVSLGPLGGIRRCALAGRPGGAVSLAVGMASIFAALPGMAGLMAYWSYNFV